MRRALGLAAAAVLATGTLGATGAADGAHATPSTTAAAAAAKPDHQALVAGALKALAAHPGQARDGDATAFTATDTMVDADGSRHVRMTRTYHGLRVLGGDLVVHQGPGAAWRGVSQTLRAPLTLGVRPSLGRSGAVSRALSPARATRSIRNLRSSKQAPELVVDALGAQPRLEWVVTTLGRQADGTPSRLDSYVDARTGKVVRRIEGVETVDGDGQSLYSGDVPISVKQSGSGYTLTDVAHGNAATTDMQNKQDGLFCQLFGAGCSNGVAFTSPDTTFGDGTTGNRESAAVDAHYGGATTFDYYQQVHGRAGIFGNGTGAPSRVHYGNGYVNAFWDGEKMTYGDGDGDQYGPLVSLDVAGHEMSHGVTENTANLTYDGESGGLNESTSDIFGTMVEFFADNTSDPGDYLIGEQFDSSGQGLRRMDDPASDGASYSCYDSGVGNADVHYSSGVGNHFFYLLAEGSGAKTINGVAHDSPTCDGSTVSGVGRDAAQQIWFRALTHYFTSGTTYAQARTATLSAAADLYGSGSAEHDAVASAWSAVNVG